MNIFSKPKPKKQIVGKHFVHTDEDKKKFVTAINRLTGQLNTIKEDLMNDNACDDTLVQIMAVKGGVEKVGRELVGKGILDCLGQYSREELELVIKNMFKLD